MGEGLNKQLFSQRCLQTFFINFFFLALHAHFCVLALLVSLPMFSKTSVYRLLAVLREYLHFSVILRP